MSLWLDVPRLHVGDISCLRMCVFFGSSLNIFPYLNLKGCVICASVIQGHPIVYFIILCVCLCWRVICLYRVLYFLHGI